MRTTATTDLARLREITAVVIRHGFGHVIHSNRKQREARKSGLSHADPAAGEQSLAERFTSLLEDLGPTFVKLGQVLSTRSDLLPPAFIEALSRLQV